MDQYSLFFVTVVGASIITKPRQPSNPLSPTSNEQDTISDANQVVTTTPTDDDAATAEQPPSPPAQVGSPTATPDANFSAQLPPLNTENPQQRQPATSDPFRHPSLLATSLKPPLGGDPIAEDHVVSAVDDAVKVSAVQPHAQPDVSSPQSHGSDKSTCSALSRSGTTPYETMQDFLVHSSIKDATCIPFKSNNNKKMYLFMFQTETKDVEKYFQRLSNLGLTTPGVGFVEVVPVSMTKGRGEDDIGDLESNRNLEKRKTNFNDTIKSRIAVSQLAAMVEQGAGITFDYLALLVVASMLACIGLAVNSVVVIVASMLVSPLMGPILGVTFGAVVADYELAEMGIKSELVGLGVCILVGFVGGLIATVPCYEAYNWPTEEMASRGTWQGLIIGIFVAIPSGVGVALSVLGNNTSSLVGVAISASLLPPAVNSGLLLAFASLDGALQSSSSALDLLGMAGISLSLTLINILIVWIFGIAMFRFKEVSRKNVEGDDFWGKGLANARHFNTVARNSPEGKSMKEHLKAALRERRQMDTVREDLPYIPGQNDTAWRININNPDFFKAPGSNELDARRKKE